MDDQTRKRLLQETASQAEALLEDMRHIRRVLADPAMLKGDVRRLSHIARRLLTDGGQGELGRVAAPRIGKVNILAPDTEIDYRAQEVAPALQWISGGAPIAGVTARGFQLYEGKPDFERLASLYRSAGGLREKMLPLHQFMDQRVTFYRGVWCNRREVIDYVANVGHGVHSGRADTESREALKALAATTNVGLQVLDMSTLLQRVPREKACDGVSYEMLCTLHFVSHAEDVRRLECAVEAELAA